MAITLSSEQQAFVEAIREFCARECGTREQRDALTKNGSPHSPEIATKLADLGWLGVGIPEAYGGAGRGMVDLCLFIEETARGMAPIQTFAVTSIVAGVYERFASEDLKQDVLGGISRGAVEAIAMSEPEAGSDVASLICRATRNDGGFVLNGQKTWCSNAHLADHIVVVARTSTEGDKHAGLTMFSVPSDAEGLEIRGIDTMGGREVCDLFLTDCHVPTEHVIGEVDQGWSQLIAGLNVERLLLAALMLGFGQRAFDDALAYVKERRQFGRTIGSFQVIKHRVADLATELECCRLLVYDVASSVDQDPGRLFPREASMAKLKVTETAKRVALEGMQMMGGYGYASEYDMERLVRTTVVSTIYGGTSEIQRDIVARTFGL